MARKLRIEFPGACYHVINRGNYRADIFATAGAKDSFLNCLWQAADKANWRLHAFVLMRNHYHLAVETPDGNLVEGMRWLQSTFANRFNRLRGESGHVFQGRYRSILLEDFNAVGAVAHYLHLNPVRAGIITADDAGKYPHSSLVWLDRPRQRPARLDLSAALQAAGGLADTPAGRSRYRAYLAWLSTDAPAQKELAFDRMSRGWVLGTLGFKRALLEDQRVAAGQIEGREADTRELRELVWQSELERCLAKLKRAPATIASERKSAAWKTAVAAHLRSFTTATNPWLAEHLQMGAADSVSRYVAEAKRGIRPEAHKLVARLRKLQE